ncbi:MAG: hypothetical protein RBU37_28455 [Myxococcota bacterium]|nr:hypothetical protein [Myxococcota bacterium]
MKPADHLCQTAWLLVALSFALAVALLACGEDPKPPPPPPPPPELHPYDSAAFVRFVQLAPSLPSVEVMAPVPSSRFSLDETGLVAIQEPPFERSLGNYAYASYSREFYLVPSGTLEFSVWAKGQQVAELSAEMQQGRAYLLALVESSARTELVAFPYANELTSAPADENTTLISVFHAAASVQRVNLALSGVDSSQTAQWPLDFGVQVLDRPSSLSAGAYSLLSLDASNVALDLAAPTRLELLGATMVTVLIADPFINGELPKMLFMMDRPGALELHPEPEGELIELP